MASSNSPLSLAQSLSTALAFAVVVQSAPHRSNQPQITWSTCPGFNSTDIIDCGTIHVPLAYFDTSNTCPDEIDLENALQSDQTITLGMSRFKATGPKRLGSVVFNPGGPGGVASDGPLVQASGIPIFGEGLVSHYDIIGLDPRGIGLSQPVKCDADLWNDRVNIFANTDEKYEAVLDWGKRVGEDCKKRTGPLFNHLDTIHVVHDMELVRRALGEGKLNFLGFSYGTMIGTQYAEFFPTNIGRMVLDGQTDHSTLEIESIATESLTFERTLDYFFAWCATNTTCALHDKDLPTLFDKLITDANHTPVPAPQCQESKACRSHVTGHDFLISVQHFLAQATPTPKAPTVDYPHLSQHLAAAIFNHNASYFAALLALSETDATYPGIAIACQDWTHTARSAVDVRHLTDMLGVVAPHTRGSTQFLQIEMMCVGWPAPVSNPQRPFRKGILEAPEVLMVNALYDPETSIVWADSLQKQLPKARLVTRRGAGHTSYFLKGEVTRVVDEYFVTGEMPEDGAVFDS